MPVAMSKKFSQHRENAILNRIQYWKRVKHMMDLHETKEQSIHFSKKMLDDQTIKTNSIDLEGHWLTQC